MSISDVKQGIPSSNDPHSKDKTALSATSTNSNLGAHHLTVSEEQTDSSTKVFDKTVKSHDETVRDNKPTVQIINFFQTIAKIFNQIFRQEIQEAKSAANFLSGGVKALVGDKAYLSEYSLNKTKLTADFECNGKVVGRETVERFNVVQMTKEQTQKRLDHLNTLENTPDIQTQKERCEKIISECDSRIQKGTNWIGSSDFRDELEKAASALKEKSLDAGVKEFTELMQKRIPAAANFRNHKAVSGGTEINMVRLGAMTDMSNNYVNLGELKEMVKDDNKRSIKYQELEKQLELEIKKQSSSSSSRKAIVLKYALDQLATPETLKAALADRSFHMKQQFLQVVRQHVANTGDPASLGSMLPMAHISLLNQYSNGDDPTGAHNDEGNSMRDMQSLFEEMKDCRIVFDGQGPYIDDDNVIHLEECKVTNNQGEQVPKEVTLKPIFFNISVQESSMNDGGRVNNGDQAKINGDSIEYLKKLINDVSQKIDGKIALENSNHPYVELKENLEKLQRNLTGIKERLDSKESSYELASALQDALLESRFLRYSVNCRSAKDRTGIMCALGALHHAMRHNPKDADQIRKENAPKMFDFGRPALEIARECGRVSIHKAEVLSLKSPEFNIPDYTFVGWKGPILRIVELVGAGLSFVQPVARAVVFLSNPNDSTPPTAPAA